MALDLPGVVTRLPRHSIVGRRPPRRGDRPSRRGTHPSGHLPGAFVDEEATTRRTFTPSRSSRRLRQGGRLTPPPTSRSSRHTGVQGSEVTHSSAAGRLCRSRRRSPLSTAADRRRSLCYLRQGKARDFGELSQVHSHAMVDLSSVTRLHYLHNHAIKAKQVRFEDGCHQLHRVDIASLLSAVSRGKLLQVEFERGKPCK
ncbi:hypothetical protein ACP70R_043597 [Stipagrostis hirtigluma subsp. patula]